jgi:hypothetical protein
LLASAEAYTPRATKLLEAERERLGPIDEVALALSENLPQPKTQPARKRRRRRRKKKGAQQEQQQQQGEEAVLTAAVSPAEPGNGAPVPESEPAPVARAAEG